MAKLTGRILDGKYRLTRQIGEGGMGTVWEGEHTRIHNRVAIKVMHRIEDRAPNILERFFLEAKTAGQIGHPNIVKVFDVGVENDGTAFMVMELLNGLTLAELLKERGGLSPQRTIAIVLQILSALLSAHRKGIIHRDLKPDNVFLASDERGREDVKLLDFGLAKIEDEDSKFKKLTQPGTVVGTPHYLSPEQAAAEPDIDARLDIWAIGVMMYEMLAGQVPFDGKTYNEVIVKIIMHSPRPIRELAPQVPEELAEIISKAMAKDRAQRYTSAADLVRALLPLSDNFFDDVGTTSVQAIKETAKQPSFLHKLDENGPPKYHATKPKPHNERIENQFSSAQKGFFSPLGAGGNSEPKKKKSVPKGRGLFDSSDVGILFDSNDDQILFSSSDDIIAVKSPINEATDEHVRLPQPKKKRAVISQRGNQPRSPRKTISVVAGWVSATLLSIITKTKGFFSSRRRIIIGVVAGSLAALLSIITATYSGEYSDKNDLASSAAEATSAEQSDEQPPMAPPQVNALSTKPTENSPIAIEEDTEPTSDNSEKDDAVSAKIPPTGGGTVALGVYDEASDPDETEKDSVFSAKTPQTGGRDTLGEYGEPPPSEKTEKNDDTSAEAPSAGQKNKVTIEIENLPPDARVYVNGKRRRHPIQIAESMQKSTLKVICPGYLPHIQRITPSEDMKIQIYMKKRATKRASNKGSKSANGKVRWKNNPFN